MDNLAKISLYSMSQILNEEFPQLNVRENSIGQSILMIKPAEKFIETVQNGHYATVKRRYLSFQQHIYIER
jgi:hypothetical protein